MSDKKIKILIVDDELGILEEIRDFLIEEGYRVEIALDGGIGLRKMDEFQPDIIVTDLKLPDISGIDILKSAKQKYPKMKVVVSTGYVDQALIDAAEKYGRDDFIQKPFDLETIKDAVDRLTS